MLNGPASKAVYYSVLGLVALCLGAEIIGWLFGVEKPIPDDVKTIMGAGLAFLFGTHVKAPIATDPDVTHANAGIKHNSAVIEGLESRIDTLEVKTGGTP